MSNCFDAAVQAAKHARDILMRDNQCLGTHPPRDEELRRLDAALKALTGAAFDTRQTKEPARVP